MTAHFNPDDAHLARALDGQQLQFRENRGAGKTTEDRFSVPPSLLPARLQCDACGSAARNEHGDELDLLHLPGCTLVPHLDADLADDLAHLTAAGEDQRFTRQATWAEVELRASERIDVTGAPVVVSGLPAGGRTRWFPTIERLA